MPINSFSDLSVEQVRRYLEERNESDLALIDVRGADEYQAGHLPGGLLFPLPDLEASLSLLPRDKELIVYCRSGNRSRVASEFIVQSGGFDRPVFNMAGGINAWQGKVLADFPRFRVFDLKADLKELLKTAMDLEKGALLFYLEAAKKAGPGPIREAFERLSRDEEIHARSLFEVWAGQDEALEFEAYFASLKGEHVEGGERLRDMVARLKGIEGGFCLNALELALDLEYTAFDLYRNMAELRGGKEEGRILLDLAQAEKSHLRRVTAALADC